MRRVICLGIDCPGPLWTKTLMENITLIGRAYPMSESS
jgi:hypothetical protein